jgi:hypothetical protein
MATSFYSNPFDLLGQTEAARSSTDLPGAVEPRFAIDWSSFHQNFFSSIPVLFQRVPAEEGQPALKIFRQDSLLGGMERWTFLMAAREASHANKIRVRVGHAGARSVSPPPANPHRSHSPHSSAANAGQF